MLLNVVRNSTDRNILSLLSRHAHEAKEQAKPDS
jgi:hypothetical protein